MSTVDTGIQGQMGGEKGLAPLDFEARVIGEISRLAEVQRERDIGEGIRRAVLRERFETRRRPLGAWLVGLAALVVGGVGGWVLARQTEPAAQDEVFAFDGGTWKGTVEPIGYGGEVVRDSRGRITEIRRVSDGGFEGERLVFRSERLIRSEQWLKGKLNGPAIDYASNGQIVAIRTWVDGVEKGVWVEFDDAGLVSRSGIR